MTSPLEFFRLLIEPNLWLSIRSARVLKLLRALAKEHPREDPEPPPGRPIRNGTSRTTIGKVGDCVTPRHKIERTTEIPDVLSMWRRLPRRG